MNPKPTKEELRDMLEKGMSLYQISRMYNTTIPEIFQLEKDYDMKVKTFKLKECYHISKEDLESMYIDERMTQQQIAEEIGYDRSSVSNMMKYYNIPTRQCGKYTAQQRSSKADEIEQRYNNGETEEEIAEKVGYSIVHVSEILRERGVQTRPGGKYTAHQRASKADEAVRLYDDEHLTQKEIAEKVGYTRGNVKIILRERGVQTRGSTGMITTQKLSLITADNLQELIDKGMNQHQIAQHFGISDWKIFDLCEKSNIPGMVDNLRCTTPEYQAWKYDVLDRDHRTCQLCGKTGVHLEVHHVIRWADAPDLRYNVDNGVPLCHECHKKVTGHEYEYAQYFLDITQPQHRDHGIVESMPWQPPLELHSIIYYPEDEV